MRFVLFFTSVLRSGIAGSYGSSSFHFVKNLIFYRAIPIYIPTNTVNVFFFFTSLTIFGICVLFNDCHSDRCEVISHSVFDMHFPDD